MGNQLVLTAIPNIPLIEPGDDLARIVLTALDAAGIVLAPGDVLALASKIVSKAEGRLVNLAAVNPSREALAVAARCGKDPRLVQVILDESTAVSRVRPGLLIVRHRLGFVCANAGVDRSNIAGPTESGLDEWVLLLPVDPDGSATVLRRQLEQASGVAPAIVIVDSHGRPHRMGTVGVAIGAAGLPTLQDWRGRRDLYDRPLQHTEVGLADLLASAASLLLGQADEGTPLILLRGVPFQAGFGSAADLVRPPDLDMYQ